MFCLRRVDDQLVPSLDFSLTNRWTGTLYKKTSRVMHLLGPTILALAFASASSGVAHAQGTMDFSGAQTLMGTFKTFSAFLRRADEGTLSRLMVETTIMLAAARTNPASVLRDAANTYKVDTDAIALKVKQEFTAKEKAKKSPQNTSKPAKNAA
jgi:hypothetical protein